MKGGERLARETKSASPSPEEGEKLWFKRSRGRLPWLRRTLELARLQAAIDEKKRWIDEMHRQMGERLAPFGEPLPDPEELTAWRESLRRSRSEIAYLQQRRMEIENPELAHNNFDTKPRIISGGAVALKPLNKPEDRETGPAYTVLNPIPEATPPAETPENEALEGKEE